MGYPTQPVLDIMRRSMANLAFVEERQTPKGPYAVTQLINTFLGALVHPWEAMRDDLKQLPLDVAAAHGWPKVEKEWPDDADPKSLGDLLRLLRNGMAHGNIEFLPDKRRQIRGFRVWNTNHAGHRTWGAVVTVKQARAFLHAFADLMEKFHQGAPLFGQAAE